MQIFVNGSPHELESPCSVAQLLEHLNMAPNSCATAVNGVFVARQDRATHALGNRDQVMTFEPITGG